MTLTPKTGGNTVTVREGETSDIVCTATRSRPAVTVKWYHTSSVGQDTEITDGVSQTESTNPSDSETFDVESTLQYTASKDYNGFTLKCVTTGQLAAESKEDTATLNVECKFSIINI